MLLTNCAACAAPLAHTAPRCIRCQTRYCNKTCQHDHWRRGHKQICKKIHRGGNAEQYYANKKYKEAVAEAVEACAEDTKGQKCYICLEAVHPHTGEGLVRGCACGDRDGVASGRTGVAHVSCLAEQAKILLAEADENHLDYDVAMARWKQWTTCGLCEQEYHGVVRCALGWACWKTYVGQKEGHSFFQDLAFGVLGNGLHAADHDAEALAVREAEFSMKLRLGELSEESMLVSLANLASSYEAVGQTERALKLLKNVYSRRLKLHGEEDERTLRAANNYASSLYYLQKNFKEAKALLRKRVPVARRILGEGHRLTLKMRLNYAQTLYMNVHGSTLDDLHESVTTLEDLERRSQRVLGIAHPFTKGVAIDLFQARTELSLHETPPSPGDSPAH